MDDSRSSTLAERVRVLLIENNETDTEDFEIVLFDIGLSEVSVDNALYSRERITIDLEKQRKNGESIQHELSLTPVHGEDGKLMHYVGIQRDVTRRTEMEHENARQHRELQYHDWLTDLPNRHSFRKSLKSAIDAWLAERRGKESAKGFAGVFLDIDEFNAVNGCFGHATGDEVLGKVAERLVRVFRADDLVTRAGGDEFKLLLKGVRRDSVHQLVLERIERAFSEPFQCLSTEVYLTVSAGVAHSDLLVNHEGEDPLPIEEMSRAADRAMYDAKSISGTVVQLSCFESAQTERWSLQGENALRTGLLNNEIVPFYQPIVRLDGEGPEGFETIGHEALARWRRSEDELVMPADFIPLAERSGLITELTESLLQQACVDFSEQPRPPGTMNPNGCLSI